MVSFLGGSLSCPKCYRPQAVTSSSDFLPRPITKSKMKKKKATKKQTNKQKTKESNSVGTDSSVSPNPPRPPLASYFHFSLLHDADAHSNWACIILNIS